MDFKIKELREKAGLSQAELSKESGVSQNLIARLESGSLTNTTTDTLFKIANALGVRVEQLFLHMMFNKLNALKITTNNYHRKDKKYGYHKN